MKIFIIVLAIIFLLILFLLCKKTYFEINVADSDVVIRLDGKKRRIKLYEYKKTIQSEAKEKSDDSNIKALIKPLRVFKDIYKHEKYPIKLVLLTLRERIKVEKADVTIKYGFNDAATTGIANGAIWSVLSLIIKIADKYINLKPVLNTAIVPVFTESCFDYKVKMVVSIRIIKLFRPLIGAYKIFKRNRVLLNTLREGE